MLDTKKLTVTQYETVMKNWIDGIVPAECTGQCNLVEGGGELACHACFWTDTDIYVEPIRNA